MTAKTNSDVVEAFRANSMLVSMSIRRFPLHVSDRKAAHDAEEASNAKTGAVKATKNRLHGADSRHKKVCTELNVAYSMHRHLTLPWQSQVTQARLLSNTRFGDYVTKLGKQQVVIDKAIAEFRDNYDSDVATAVANLGELAPSVYPSALEASTLFGIDVNWSPLATAMTDGYIGLPDGASEWLAERFNQRASAAATEAIDLLVAETVEAAIHLRQALKDGTKFHATSITNLTDKVKMLRAFAFAGDPRLENLAGMISSEISHYRLETIKATPGLAMEALTKIINAV